MLMRKCWFLMNLWLLSAWFVLQNGAMALHERPSKGVHQGGIHEAKYEAFTCLCFAINKRCYVGNIAPPFIVGIMNNAAADVEIMPVVVRAQNSLWYLHPLLCLSGEKETLVTLDDRLTRDSWPNKRHRGWVQRRRGKGKRIQKIKRDGGGVIDRKTYV